MASFGHKLAAVTTLHLAAGKGEVNAGFTVIQGRHCKERTGIDGNSVDVYAESTAAKRAAATALVGSMTPKLSGGSLAFTLKLACRLCLLGAATTLQRLQWVLPRCSRFCVHVRTSTRPDPARVCAAIRFVAPEQLSDVDRAAAEVPLKYNAVVVAKDYTPGEKVGNCVDVSTSATPVPASGAHSLRVHRVRACLIASASAVGAQARC